MVKTNATVKATTPVNATPTPTTTVNATPTTQAQQANIAALALAKQNVANKVMQGVGVTQHTNGTQIKGLMAQGQIAKPTLNMLRYVSVINGHPMQGNCVKRWHLYSVGFSLLCAKLTNGTTPNDLTFWATCKLSNGKPYIVLSTPTQAQYTAILALHSNGTLTPANIQAILLNKG